MKTDYRKSMDDSDSSWFPSEDAVEVESVISSKKDLQILNILKMASHKWEEVVASPMRLRQESYSCEFIEEAPHS